jgi:O-antigen/teichoic acid export membrane protein
MLSMLRRIVMLSILRSSAVFGLSGAAFAFGMLLLARVMPVEPFGELSLLLALFNIFCLLSPLGIDQIAVRHRLGASRGLLVISLSISVAVGAAVSLAMLAIGHLPSQDAVLLGASVAIGGMVVTASGLFRAAGQLGVAAWIFTGGNWGLLAIGMIGQWTTMPDATLPFLLYLLLQGVIAFGAWVFLLKKPQSGRPHRISIPWREAPALLGMAAIGTIVLQLERIIIPPLMDLAALATFSVLSSVAIFPFRIMTAGLEFSLTPRLRNELDAGRRRMLFWREMGIVAVVLAIGTMMVIAFAPWVAGWITAGKYELSLPLLLAGCLSGAVKFLQTIPRSVLTACGTAQDLAYLNLTGWAGLVLGIIGGAIGEQAGLPGIVIGVATGFALGNVPALARTRKVLR